MVPGDCSLGGKDRNQVEIGRVTWVLLRHLDFILWHWASINNSEKGGNLGKTYFYFNNKVELERRKPQGDIWGTP